VCCSVLQCVAVCCSVLQCVAVCCSVVQCVAVNVFHCVVARGNAGGHHAAHGAWNVLQCVAVCCSMLQCVAVCCCVLQCGAVWCSVLQPEKMDEATVVRSGARG